MAGAESPRQSDLATRTVSALVMLVVSGFALWAGGWAWLIFVLVIGIGVWFEWSALVLKMYPPGGRQTAWRYGGAVYCGIACAVLLALRDMPDGLFVVLMIVGAVIGTDIGAYLFGRTIGGPKIAPKISPSKTWAGLVGGMIGATLAIILISYIWHSGLCEVINPAPRMSGNRVMFDGPCSLDLAPISYLLPNSLMAGAILAVLAQVGDFFESWMKRKAGVKDSGKLLPGHGGLFDRVDGLLLVLVVIGNVILLGQVLDGL
jgi:phosphatidate cytidylyltransferase